MITSKTIQFLSENKSHNSREWFQSHKEDYQKYVIEPLRNIAIDLTPFIESVDPYIICDPKVDKTISRIYRDIRFSADKSLYRDEVWIAFMRDKKLYPCYPQFYLYITPYKFSYGCGYFAATKEAMDSIRSAILAKDPEFVALYSKLQKQKRFSLAGERYKRDQFPNEPDTYKDWLNRKNIFYEAESENMSELFSVELSDRLIDDFQKLIPLYRFLLHAEERK